MITRIEQILLEASTYYIKDAVVEEASRLYRQGNDELDVCYEEAFLKIMKKKGYEKDL